MTGKLLEPEDLIGALRNHGGWMTRTGMVKAAGGSPTGVADHLRDLVARGIVAANVRHKQRGIVEYRLIDRSIPVARAVPDGPPPKTQIDWINWGLRELEQRPDDLPDRDLAWLAVVVGQMRQLTAMTAPKQRQVDRCGELVDRMREQRRAAYCGSGP